jgi:hypothetical protein
MISLVPRLRKLLKLRRSSSDDSDNDSDDDSDDDSDSYDSSDEKSNSKIEFSSYSSEDYPKPPKLKK